jgi:hypothetical protein
MSQPFPEPQSDPVETFLPESSESLSPEADFARFEENIDDAPADLVVQETLPTPVGRSWAFDFNTRDFVSGPYGHGPLTTHGEATLDVWITKALQTARGAHPIYSDDYGMEVPGDFIGGPVEHFPTDRYHDSVREALIVNENIADVIDLHSRFDPDANYVALSFTVVRATGATLRVNAQVPL